MSRRADATKVAVQVESARTDVWVEDGRSPASYPVDGVPLRNLLAMPDDVLQLAVTTPLAGYGTFPAIRKDETLSDVLPTVVTRSSTNGPIVESLELENKTSRTIGPVVVQTKFPTPVSAGDKVSFAGRFAMRRTNTIVKNSDDDWTPLNVRVSLWGLSSNTDEYGVVEDTATELLSYETQLQGQSLGAPSGTGQVVVTIPSVSPATVPAGVGGVHLTVTIIANRKASWWDAGLREFFAASYDFPYRKAKFDSNKNFFTHANVNPLRLTVVPKTPPTPGVPAAQWETLTQEQNRLHRYTYEDITDHVNEITTEKIEADLGVSTVRLISTEVPAKLVAGKRVRILALHSDGNFTVLVAGTIRTRRVVEDGRHPSQVEIGVHDSHGRLGAMKVGVAFDTLAEYAPVLNRAGIPAVIDGDEVTGPARDLPPWGGVEPSYRDTKLTMLDALTMTRNARKAFVRLTRHDRLEVLSALPAGIALDVSDVPGQGDASFSVDAEFGSDTKDLINQVSVREHLMDSADFDRSITSQDPPLKFGHMKSRTQTAEYRRPTSIATYGLASKAFRVARGTGKLTDIELGNYGSSFAAWAAAILDEYSIERSGPKSITIPVETDAQWALVSKLEVLDAVVVRFRGVAYVQRIRRVTHKISPGGLRKVLLRFDVTGDQTYWMPATAAPAVGPGTVKPYVPNPKGPAPPPLFAATTGVDGGDTSPAPNGNLDGGTP